MATGRIDGLFIRDDGGTAAGGKDTSSPATLEIALKQAEIRLDLPATTPEAAYRLRVWASPGQKFQIQSSRDLKKWDSVQTLTVSDNFVDFIDLGDGYFCRWWRAVVVE